jgi:hypothetical protein
MGRGITMRTKRLAEKPTTYVMILDTGEELMGALKQFAKES